jgi:hypothetical protein
MLDRPRRDGDAVEMRFLGNVEGMGAVAADRKG